MSPPKPERLIGTAPLIAASARPGQFVMLRVRDGGERIPITIADYDRAGGTPGDRHDAQSTAHAHDFRVGYESEGLPGRGGLHKREPVADRSQREG